MILPKKDVLNVIKNIKLHLAAAASYQKISQMDNVADIEFPKAQMAFESKKVKSHIAKDIQLKALFKQATKGDCEGARPTGTFNAGAKADYGNWAKLKGMDIDYAKREFVRVAKLKGLDF